MFFPYPQNVIGGDEIKTVVADPPWRPLLHANTVGRTAGIYRAGPQRYYKTMPIEEICATFKLVTAPKAHLWLWVLNQHVDWGHRLARLWSFEPQQLITWAKPGLGTGTFQCNSESVLVCRKGGPVDNAFQPSGGTCFDWPRGRHSAKPDEFYALVERVSRGPYLDAFARKVRPNWHVWGDECFLPA